MTSLARLWQKQGEQEGAREVLAGVYSWFAEGFATADLREARILLEQVWLFVGNTVYSNLISPISESLHFFKPLEQCFILRDFRRI